MVDLHYGGLNAGDLQTGMVVYHPSSVFIDHRPLGWGTLDLDGIRTRLRTIAESPDRYFHYLRRAVRYSSTSLCEIGRNHAITADGFVNDSDILSIFTMDPATGLGVRTEQFDPEDLDAALARFDEIVAAELATAIPPNRAVLSGGLANLRARHPEPDRFIDGLADDFTATLPDGSTVDPRRPPRRAPSPRPTSASASPNANSSPSAANDWRSSGSRAPSGRSRRSTSKTGSSGSPCSPRTTSTARWPASTACPSAPTHQRRTVAA